MNIKSKLIAAVLGLSAAPLAMSASLGEYKLAVIEGVPGASEIMSGDYGTETMTNISRNNSVEMIFATNMNLCVALMKSKNLAASEEACSKAVDYASRASGYFQDASRIKALAYSNRGVVRKLMNNNTGAFEDFKKAVRIDKNTITDANLSKLVVSLNTPVSGSTYKGGME